MFEVYGSKSRTVAASKPGNYGLYHQDSTIVYWGNGIQPIRGGKIANSGELDIKDPAVGSENKANEPTIVQSSNRDNTFQDADSESEDDIDESAIEEGGSDDDDWEDNVSEVSESSSVTDCSLFQRVDSKPNLTSHKSLLTDAFQMNVCALAPVNAASRSAPAIGRSTGSSPQEDGLMMMQSQASRPKPIIMPTSNVHLPAMSPKTARRNMLTSELTGSLLQNMLLERQQRDVTTNAVAKRQQSAMNTGDIEGFNNNNKQQQPQQNGAKTGPFIDHSKLAINYNKFFDSGPGAYHKSGW